MVRIRSLSKKPRICFIVTTLDFGGAEVQVVDLATHLVQRHWEVLILSLMHSTALEKRAAAAGIELASLGIKKTAPNPRLLIHLDTIVSEWKPNLIHSHMFHANLLSRLYRLRNRSIPLISTIHNIFEGKSLSQSNRRCMAYRITDPLSNFTTIISRVAYQRYATKKAVSLDKFLHIPNGIDTDVFCPLDDLVPHGKKTDHSRDDFVWLTIGSIEKQKDYPNLIRGFKKVLKLSSGARLQIVGEGSLLNEMKTLSRREGIHHQIEWLGRRQRSEILDLMRKVDAFVIASQWEGLPMVLLEAAACGLPIVATDVGGNNEVVVHNRTGWIVTPRRPYLLARAMFELMRMPVSQRREVGMAGRKHVIRHFDINHIVDTWEWLYIQCLEKTTCR
jgi:glycosyltransferase involved in cell wall biosynthesis